MKMKDEYVKGLMGAIFSFGIGKMDGSRRFFSKIISKLSNPCVICVMMPLYYSSDEERNHRKKKSNHALRALHDP